MRIYSFVVLLILSASACPNPPLENKTKTSKPEITKPVEAPKVKTPEIKKSKVVKMTALPEVPTSIKTQPLSGKINAKDWKFVGGTAKKFGDKLKIALYDQPLDGCAEPKNPGAPSILLPDMPLSPGSGDFSFKIMAGFKYKTDKPQNDFAVAGKWRLDKVGPKVVSGGMAVDYRNHVMDGNFEIPLCE